MSENRELTTKSDWGAFYFQEDQYAFLLYELPDEELTIGKSSRF